MSRRTADARRADRRLGSASDFRACGAGIASGVTDQEVVADLATWQENLPSNDAFEGLIAGWDASDGPDRAAMLQRGYAFSHKNGSEFMLDTLGGKAPPPYVAAHAKYNPYLADVISLKGYRDGFLIKLNGDCIWSYSKEPEFTSNFLTGPYSQVGLGEVFQKSLKDPTKSHVSPFLPWAPSNGELASFICTGFFLPNGSNIGSMCIQRSSDALDFAGNVRFREAMAGFVAEWPGIGSSGARKAYVDTNKYGTGVDGDRLDFADGPEKYHAVHKQHHAYFRELASTKGYFDFLLIDLQGTIMYSISKGLEFGTNLRTGPYKSTGLAKAFSDATKNPDVVTETQFEPYVPSDNALSSFIATGVKGSGGSLIGILALVAPAPLLVSLDANGDCVESYSVLNVQSSGGVTNMVQVGLYSFEKPDWKYANAHARQPAAPAILGVLRANFEITLDAGTGNWSNKSFGPVHKQELLCRTKPSRLGCSLL